MPIGELGCGGEGDGREGWMGGAGGWVGEQL